MQTKSMIHTYNFIIPITEDHITNLVLHYDLKPIKRVLRDLQRAVPGTTINLVTGEITYFSIQIDAIVALGSYDVKPEDIDRLHRIHDSICNYLMIYELEDLNHTRIDYRFDVKVPSKEHRRLIIKLLNKARSKHYRLKKHDEYDTSVFLRNKSMEVKIYDKAQERLDTGKPVHPEEQDVLRIEVALRNRHLKYNKKKKEMSKDISTYLTTELFLAYMAKIEEVFFTGNFYHLKDVEEILEEHKVHYTDRKGIRGFMIDLSKKGFQDVKDSGKYSYHMTRKYLAILKSLNIHPLVIPKNSLVEGYSKETPLLNPINEIGRFGQLPE